MNYWKTNSIKFCSTYKHHKEEQNLIKFISIKLLGNLLIHLISFQMKFSF